MSFVRRHRLAIGYVLVASAMAALGLAATWFYPDVVLWLGAHGYELEEPRFLWVTAIIPLLWFVRLHSLTDLPLLQQLLSTALRSAMIVALAAGLTGVTRLSHESKKVATVVLVDVSDSVPDAVLTTAHAHVQALFTAKQPEDTVRLVTFAEQAQAVPMTPDAEGKVPAITRHTTGTLGTNLEEAMRLAYSLYPPGHLKRLVVVTDGNETAGNALTEAETARRLGITVSHLTLPALPPRHELMVTGFDVPDDLEVNVPFDVGGSLLASSAGRAKCTLLVDRVNAGTSTVDHGAGETSVHFADVRVKSGGEHAFRIDCVPAAPEGATPEALAALDGFTTNNHFEASRLVPEKKKLLYVEGEGLYSKAFRDAMADDFEVEVRGARGLPRSLEDARKFQAIVVSDVPQKTPLFLENITTGQQRMLHEYANLGGLLVFMGGQDSLGPGGYSGSYLERQVLPVKLDVEHEKETPRVALAIVMDRSGSMQGKKIELAKEAAIQTLTALNRDDRVGVIAFDNAPMKLIGMTSARNATLFEAKMRSLVPGGGTSIYPALEAGFRMLEGTPAQVKHVILLTDGQSPKEGMFYLVEQAARKGITVSAIAIGRGSDTALLAGIAEHGRGRYYYTESPEAIPKLFLDETKEITKDAVVSESFKAVLAKEHAGLRFLKGIDLASAPPLSGHVTTQAKKGVDVILKTQTGEPLLVRWKREKGWVYVWTSDIKNKWASKWIRWAGFAPFWRQLVKDAMPEEKKDTVFPIELAVARGKLTVSTDAVDANDQFIGGVTSRATIVEPDGARREVTLSQTAPGRLSAELPVSKYGPYRVDVVHEREGQKIAISNARAAYPYAEEHLHFEPDLSRVQALTRATGGFVDPTANDLLARSGEVLASREPVWHWPVYAVLAVLLLDVLLRRVRLWRARTLRWGELG